MHKKFKNVNQAFFEMVKELHEGTITTHNSPSRVGDVCVINEPTIITYENPTERVLLNAERDANPFFHLIESLWMLAGRNDLASLQHYVSTFGQFSDDGKTLNGAYGYRWRNDYNYYTNEVEGSDDPNVTNGGTDQLGFLIEHLKNNPYSRRAVLAMWNVRDDLLKINESADVCCNLSACFLIENGTCNLCDKNGLVETTTKHNEHFITRDLCPKCQGMKHDVPRYLNMTVFNRSNDLIWGTLGANAVHFSFLQEYMAGQLGLEVGVYNQVSNNTHFYTERWEAEKWLSYYNSKVVNPYKYFSIKEQAYKDVILIEHTEGLLAELPKFFADTEGVKEYDNKYLSEVAQPVKIAFNAHKARDYEKAKSVAEKIQAQDWRLACLHWIAKRKENYERKNKRL